MRLFFLPTQCCCAERCKMFMQARIRIILRPYDSSDKLYQLFPLSEKFKLFIFSLTFLSH